MENLKGSSLGYAQALLANIKLGWNDLPVEKTQAYCENAFIMAVKRFITLGPGDFYNSQSLKNSSGTFYETESTKISVGDLSGHESQRGAHDNNY